MAYLTFWSWVVLPFWNLFPFLRGQSSGFVPTWISIMFFVGFPLSHWFICLWRAFCVRKVRLCIDTRNLCGLLHSNNTRNKTSFVYVFVFVFVFFCNSVFHYWRSETPWVGLRPPGLRNVTIFLPIWNIQLVAELCVYIGTHFSWLLLLTFSLALFCLLCKQHN